MMTALAWMTRGISLEMEWHMKRPYHSCMHPELSEAEGFALQPDLCKKWVLLWRENQRHRPPSKL